MGIQRDSNIELFRVILMLLIIAHHFSLHYVIKDGLPLSSFERLYILLIGAWGKVAVDCFVIITGYFMCKSRITAKKFAKLVCEFMFYRWVFYLIFLISGYDPFSGHTSRPDGRSRLRNTTCCPAGLHCLLPPGSHFFPLL